MKRTSRTEKHPTEDVKKEETIAEELEIEKKVKAIKVEEAPSLFGWKPKTKLGEKAQKKEITIDEILDKGYKILEPEIVDALLPGLETALLEIGQSKGKYGGGKRSIWKQTQKKTQEGNKLKFAIAVVVGNRNGYVGLGKGHGKETVPAREKAIRNAKLNLIRIKRGCGSWDCNCREPHSIPFKVKGKVGGAEITLIPAPKGIGLFVNKQCKGILQLAGIKDAYSKAVGTTSTLNLVRACLEALKKLSSIKIDEKFKKIGGVVEGSLK